MNEEGRVGPGPGALDRPTTGLRVGETWFTVAVSSAVSGVKDTKRVRGTKLATW